MNILHTADWHIGRMLYGRKRYDEFTAFLNWLTTCIQENKIDILLIAGDIFDTTTPSNRAQQLYYHFLHQVSKVGCRHIVVIGGNHDSPSFLDAPKALLKGLNVHVVGAITDNHEDEVIVLHNQQNQAEAIICAVPYLRDKDIRMVEPGESVEDKNQKLIDGLKKHYADVCHIAVQKQQALGDIPIIAMGHLFTSGGKTIDGDGVRELYIGSLAHVGHEVFPACIDYLALGHLHIPQKVGGQEHLRYSGSPIPMGYGEAKQEKKVLLVQFQNKVPQITELAIPCFQPLDRVIGDLDTILQRLQELKDSQSTSWIEIEYIGTEPIGNLRERAEEIEKDSLFEIRRTKNQSVVDRVLTKIHDHETLDDLNEMDVFTRCLEANNILEEHRPELIESYQQVLKSIAEEDIQSE